MTAAVGAPQRHTPLDQLFRVPLPPPSMICPQRLPGIDSESTDALIRTLSDNHVRWHIFFNYKGFHNHASHHLLAIWAMGAPGPVIDAAYVTHCKYQRPAFESPEHINRSNIYKHLGDERYYSAYLEFFTSEVLKKGLPECLEEHVFASTANFSQDASETAHPEMLSRFLEGVFHPFIHTGYGAEFTSVGISAEGLAMTAVHSSSSGLLSRTWFPDVVSQANSKGGKRSALSILALVSCDPRFSNTQKTAEEMTYANVIKEQGSIIQDYVNMWMFDISSADGIAEAVEELSWLNSTIYGVGGYSPEKPFNADFFLMHLLTSSLFLPSLLTCISKFSSRRLLLLGYFTASLTYYIARGRPRLDVRSFYKGTDFLHKVPGPITSPAPNTLPKPTSDQAQTPNAWYPLIQSTIVHPNEHLCKAQRALVHCSSLYGTRKKGWCAPPSMEEGKVGLEELDGSLFLRIAMLTQHRLGWMREGEKQAEWDFSGFYGEKGA
ncbi:hypothetical protein BS17DRAFT_709500 [Gyrodon lividus]|nr:hypothetical protein BS17DRAFT_709500 [Gyrodon lividus]